MLKGLQSWPTATQQGHGTGPAPFLCERGRRVREGSKKGAAEIRQSLDRERGFGDTPFGHDLDQTGGRHVLHFLAGAAASDSQTLVALLASGDHELMCID
jgi:hypothetical protein